MVLLFGVGCRAVGPQSTESTWQNSTVSTSTGSSWMTTLEETGLVVDDLPAAKNACRPPLMVFVDVVYDGDTFRGKVDGVDWSVRLIGYDSPETYTGECWSEEATDALMFFIADEWIWLTFDEDCYDDYDRLLAYAHTATPPSVFVNESMLRLGEGRTMTIAPNDEFVDRFLAAESTAQKNEAGLWSVCD